MNFLKSIQYSLCVIGSIILFSFTFPNWEKDFQTAQSLAKEQHKLLLLNFSGSDWCVPCIKMHKEIFENDEFISFADSKLVMYDADFPQKKKNAIPQELKEQNEQLAEKYNKTGGFPYTILLDENGNILKSWLGYPKGGLTEFKNQIEEIYRQQYASR